MRTKVLPAAVLGLAALSLAAAAPQDDQAYEFPVKYAINDLLRYKVAMNMSMEMKPEKGESPMPRMDMRMSFVVRMKTVAVKPDGGAVIVTTAESGTATSMGQPVPIPKTPPVTQEVDSRGRVVRVRGLEKAVGPMADLSQLFSMRSMPMQGFALPDHPVKIGETWETEIPFPPGEAKAKVVNTLVGTETVGSQETLKVRSVWTVPFDMKMGNAGTPVKDDSQAMMFMKGGMEITMLSNVLQADSRLVKTQGQFKAAIDMLLQGQAAAHSPFGSRIAMSLSGATTVSLVSAGKVGPPRKAGR